MNILTEKLADVGAKNNGYIGILDSKNSKGAFVNLDMKNGVNSYDRALW